MFNRYAWLSCFIVVLNALVLTDDAQSGTFDVSVSPPRIEQRARPGKIARNTVTITNFAKEAGHYLAKTADWGLTREGRVTFNEGVPNKGSCRPWVRIERHKLFAGLAARSKSSMGWFYGFNLHLILNDQSELVTFYLKPGKVGEIGRAHV